MPFASNKHFHFTWKMQTGEEILNYLKQNGGCVVSYRDSSRIPHTIISLCDDGEKMRVTPYDPNIPKSLICRVNPNCDNPAEATWEPATREQCYQWFMEKERAMLQMLNINAVKAANQAEA
jgi:hypothetical protein